MKADGRKGGLDRDILSGVVRLAKTLGWTGRPGVL